MRDSGKIILANSNMPRIIIRAPEAVEIDTEFREGGGKSNRRGEKQKGGIEKGG
jgi:hypothetical protein